MLNDERFADVLELGLPLSGVFRRRNVVNRTMSCRWPCHTRSLDRLDAGLLEDDEGVCEVGFFVVSRSASIWELCDVFLCELITNAGLLLLLRLGYLFRISASESLAVFWCEALKVGKRIMVSFLDMVMVVLICTPDVA